MTEIDFGLLESDKILDTQKYLPKNDLHKTMRKGKNVKNSEIARLDGFTFFLLLFLSYSVGIFSLFSIVHIAVLVYPYRNIHRLPLLGKKSENWGGGGGAGGGLM